MAKKTTLREKKVRKYGSSYKYDRVWVKKHFADATHVSFGRGSMLDKYDDYYWRTDRRIDNYVRKFLTKHIGENADKVYSKFVSLGFKEAGCEPERKWEQFVYGNTSLRLWRYRNWGDYFYVEEDGTLAYEPSTRHTSSKRLTGFTREQLRHNETQRIPNYGKVAKYPLGKSGERTPDGSGLTMRGMRTLGKFYVGYEGEVLLLPVYILPRSIKGVERPDWWYNNRWNCTKREAEEFTVNFRKVNIYGTEGKPLWPVHNYPVEVEYNVMDDYGNVIGTETEVEDYGYGLLETFILTAQAENELRKKRFATGDNR